MARKKNEGVKYKVKVDVRRVTRTVEVAQVTIIVDDLVKVDDVVKRACIQRSDAAIGWKKHPPVTSIEVAGYPPDSEEEVTDEEVLNES